MEQQAPNMIAIAVATLIPSIVGFIYYHPALLGKVWMNANGFTLESVGKGPKPIMFVVALAVSFLLAFFLWVNVTGAGGADPGQWVDAKDGHSYVTFQHGVAHGIILTITVLLPIFVTMTIFEKRKWSWCFVNLGYWALTFSLMLGLLSAWR